MVHTFLNYSTFNVHHGVFSYGITQLYLNYISAFAQNGAITLIIIGGIIFGVGIIGCCGGCNVNKVCLLIVSTWSYCKYMVLL